MSRFLDLSKAMINKAGISIDQEIKNIKSQKKIADSIANIKLASLNIKKAEQESMNADMKAAEDTNSLRTDLLSKTVKEAEDNMPEPDRSPQVAVTPEAQGYPQINKQIN